MEAHLSASALSSANSFFLSVSSDSFPGTPVQALLDSGSTHCFIDSSFVSLNSLPAYSVSLISLRLFDGSSNSVIVQAVRLALRFSSGEVTPVELYVTPLEASCSVVLGHNWLAKYNPSIDWSTSSLSFRSTPAPASETSPPVRTSLPSSSGLDSSVPEPSVSTPPSISFVNAPAFLRACRLPGSCSYSLRLSPSSSSAL